MRITNFKFDNHSLNSFNFIICSFGKDGIQTSSNGSEIEFNTIPLYYGKNNLLVSTKYENCVKAEFDICPKPSCPTSQFSFVSSATERQIMRWLNRKEFCKFEPNVTGYGNIYFNGSFNVEKVTFNNEIIGFHLTLITDKPFAYMDKTFSLSLTNANTDYNYSDTSDEIGISYLNVEINLPSSFPNNAESFDLELTHTFNNSSTVTKIRNCQPNETINLSYPQFSTNKSTHKINRDFNYQFLTIQNKYSNMLNKYKSNLAGVTISASYTPVIKIGI